MEKIDMQGGWRWRATPPAYQFFPFFSPSVLSGYLLQREWVKMKHFLYRFQVQIAATPKPMWRIFTSDVSMQSWSNLLSLPVTVMILIRPDSVSRCKNDVIFRQVRWYSSGYCAHGPCTWLGFLFELGFGTRVFFMLNIEFEIREIGRSNGS